jgi:hypothetical protein
MLSLSSRVFSTQDGHRKKLKISPELPGNELSEYVFKNSLQCLYPKQQQKTSDHLSTEEERHSSVPEH